MTHFGKPLIEKYYVSFLFAILLLAGAGQASAQTTPILQPGAPGQDGRQLSAEQASEIANTSYSPDDVRFMQDMIPHHHQAVEMAALVKKRTNSPELIDVAGRIDASQADEIKFMQDWLSERGEKAPDPTHHHAMHTTHEMAGMATPEQMKALADAKGTDFDALFLELMIRHHEGALEMVEELLALPGSAYDPVLYDFTTDITNDQTSEIERMNAMLVSLSSDPRAGLKAGFLDAEQAILNLELVAALPKPAGFFDPNNPANLKPDNPNENEEDDGQSNTGTEWDERSPLLSFTNTDMAFADDVMVAGSYHGFNIYRLQANGIPDLISSVVCPGGQGDVSIVGDLLIMSVEQTRGRVDCGLQGISEDVSQERFRGLRIFDISNLERPVQVGQVQTCRGSHTHSVVAGPEEDGMVLVYNSGTASVRDEEELPGCIGEVRGDDRTALFRIDIIEIPVDNPAASRIIDSPAVFADPETGRLAGLWQGGDHGEDTQETNETNHCHDITVFPELNIAAGACSGNGVIFDISDPRKPVRIDEVVDKGFAYWHSATFNNDGTKVLFTDEWGGGSRPRCRTFDPRDWGANAFYDIVDRQLEFRSYFKLPAPQVEQENCVAHNGSIIPVPGRDIFVQAWYQGGLSVIDFTDTANPIEIAYFDRGPMHEEHLSFGGYWSTYWYQGKIYGTETERGLDVLALQPSEFMTENEIAAALLANQGDVFNPQQQFRVTWPATPVVALAYSDQLGRSGALDQPTVRALEDLLDRVQAMSDDGSLGAGVSRELLQMGERLKAQTLRGPADKQRNALVRTLRALAANDERVARR